MSQEIAFLKGKFSLKTFFASLKISLKMRENFDFPGYASDPRGDLHEQRNYVPLGEISPKNVHCVTKIFSANDGEFQFSWLMHPAPDEGLYGGIMPSRRTTIGPKEGKSQRGSLG